MACSKRNKRTIVHCGSVVWNYFEYNERNNKVYCNVCKLELAYNKNASAIREHLKRKRPYQLD